MSLPSGYRKLEYIQSSGTQYIDTGFKPKQSTRVVMDLQLLSTSGVPYVFGTWAGGMNNCFSVYWWTNVHNSWGVDYGTQRSAIPQTNWNKRLTVDLNQNVVTVDGISYTLTATTFTATNNLFLLALNNGNNAIDYTVAKAKVYGCKIYDNGMLVRDFIPCKNASGAVGMWDDVNNTFYSNAGSGTFTAGPEVIGSNRVLVNAKGYDANSGTVLVNGMVYHLKKGRGLLNGMGYDISFAKSLTWYLNATIVNTYFKATVSFTSNGRRFSGIKLSPGIDPILVYFIDDENDIQPYVSGWSQPVYRTITFDEEPTGDLLTWLEANGTRQ